MRMGVSNSTDLMKPWATAPITAAGRKASTMPITKRRAPGLVGSSIATRRKRWK